jgi:hypothetical protein
MSRPPFGLTLLLAALVAVGLAGCDRLGLPGSDETAEPGSLAALLSDPLALVEGRPVTLRATLWTSGDETYLCSSLAESYPPQCGQPRLPLEGVMPDDVRRALESTAGQPGLAQVAWGEVEVTGRLDLSDGPTEPRLAIEGIRVVDIGGG